MPPRASTSAAASAPAMDSDEDDFIVPDDDDDSGDDFMADDDARAFQSRASRLRTRRGGKAQVSAKAGAGAGAGAGAKGKGGGQGGKGKAKAKAKGAGGSYAWEQTFQRSWDVVDEDESGSLEASVKHLLDAGKRKRAAREERRVRRGIIRHLVLVLDVSENMEEKDGGRGRRIDVLLPIARRFVNEYFEQNPIGQLAVLAMRDGIADRLVPMGGNTADHLSALSNANRRRLEPRGDPSLQNALEMARSSLAHLPATSSREVLLLSGSLTSCDPGNIHHTIAALKQAHIRVDLIHLTAEMKIMRDIAQETGGTFGVALDDVHLEELVREGVRPREILKRDRSGDVKAAKKRAQRADSTGGTRADDGDDAAAADPDHGSDADSDDGDDDAEAGAELMQMGFPLRLPTHAPPTLCACHSRLFPPGFRSGGGGGGGSSGGSGAPSGTGSGFLCPRCNSKVCDVPTDCPVCGLTIVMSTHLARSYRHLFPVRPWRGVSWESLAAIRTEKRQTRCRGCDESFPPLPAEYARRGRGRGHPLSHSHTLADLDSDPDSDEEQDEEMSAPDAAANGNGTASARGSGGGSAQSAAPAPLLSPSARYACPKCATHFCLECDSYVHEELFVCPGCG